jgi:hypothetical protein
LEGEYTMTTNVVVTAHCAATKEVKVTITDPTAETEHFVLQDGESADRVVYDGREISVKEVEK